MKLNSALLISVTKEVQKMLAGQGPAQGSILVFTCVISKEEDVWVLECILPFSWNLLSTAFEVQGIIHSLGREEYEKEGKS